MRVLIRRYSSFVSWRVVAVVYGLIAMTPMTFCFDKDAFADKTAVTLVLTAVAFQSATSEYIPVLPYMTRLDNLVEVLYI